MSVRLQTLLSTLGVDSRRHCASVIAGGAVRVNGTVVREPGFRVEHPETDVVEVDGRRVYVTGMSMGGAGTIRAMSVGAGLFAACVPVCPSMTPETWSCRSARRTVRST